MSNAVALDHDPDDTRSRFRKRLSGATDSWKWELYMGFLAIVFVAVSFTNDEGGSDTATVWVERAFTVFFLAEFLLRLWASRDRMEYAIDHWVDAIALVPAVRGLRILRLLRLFRLAGGLHRATARVERLDRIRMLVNLVIAWLLVMTIGAISFFAAEADRNPAVNDFFDALWWAVTTITGGQNEILPTTDDGRLAAVILLVGGVGLFAAITASVFRLLGADPNDETTRESQIQRRFGDLIALRSTGEIDESDFEIRVTAIVDEARSIQPASARPS